MTAGAGNKMTELVTTLENALAPQEEGILTTGKGSPSINDL